MKIWNLVGGAWVVRDAVILSAIAIDTIEKRPRLKVVAQLARDKDKFELIVINTTKQRKKILKGWLELSNYQRIFPRDEWQNMNIIIDAGDSITFEVPMQPLRKKIANITIKKQIKNFSLLDDSGKVHRVKLPHFVAASLLD